jgi:hypothetical protein
VRAMPALMPLVAPGRGPRHARTRQTNRSWQWHVTNSNC